VRASFDTTTRDPQFLAEAEKLDLPVVGPIPGAEAEALIATIYKSPRTLVERANVVSK
jgi:hypothetical protein